MGKMSGRILALARERKEARLAEKAKQEASTLIQEVDFEEVREALSEVIEKKKESYETVLDNPQ